MRSFAASRCGSITISRMSQVMRKLILRTAWSAMGDSAPSGRSRAMVTGRSSAICPCRQRRSNKGRSAERRWDFCGLLRHSPKVRSWPLSAETFARPMSPDGRSDSFGAPALLNCTLRSGLRCHRGDERRIRFWGGCHVARGTATSRVTAAGFYVAHSMPCAAPG